MQVGVDVTCMCTNVGGCGFSGFRDIATFKNIQISSMGTFKFPPMVDYNSPWGSKNRINSKNSCM